MGDVTKIEWTDHTFNPWIGCTNCYAEADMDLRRHRAKWGPNGTRVVTSAEYWKKPLKWNREAEAAGERRRVFCASLADVFEEWDGQLSMANGEWATINRHMGKFIGFHGCMLRGGNDALRLQFVRSCLFSLIDATPNLDWLLLTKRPENVARMMPCRRDTDGDGDCEKCSRGDLSCKHRSNAWIGTSVSDQATARKAVPELLKLRDLTPCLFLSVEPLVGFVDLSLWLKGKCDCGRIEHGRCHMLCPSLVKNAIDWVIVGGESGPKARPCDVAWVRSVVEQCRAADVPCFVKQLGARPERHEVTSAADAIFGGAVPKGAVCEGTFEIHQSNFLADPKGGDWDEWPADLRVREFPKATVQR